MKRLLLGLSCLALSFSQQSLAQAQYAFRISFVNKNGTASLSEASTFLSERALSRRQAQGIAVDSLDLPVSPDYLDSVLTLTGGVLHVTSRWFNQCVLLLSDTSQMPALRSKNYVSSVARVGYFPSPLHLKGNPAGAALHANAQKPAGDAAYYGQSYTQTALVHGDALHDAGFKGAGKLIAVLDVGFLEINTHAGFDSLRNSGRILETHNFLTNSSNVDAYTIHGTASLSTMAGYEPGLYVGSAPLAAYALYITDDNYNEQPVEEDMLIAGLERADSLGADIANLSLGYNIFTGPITGAYTPDSLNGHGTLPAKAVNLATARGIFCVVSAGNEGGNSWNYLLSPGDADSALTVGAVDANKVPAGFSGPGPNASGRVKPDICMMGNPAVVFLSFNGIGGSTGTSFAAPQAAGYAACLWQAAPGATPYALRQAIIQSADHYSNPTPKLGYGVPDFSLALQQLGVAPTEPVVAAVRVGPVPFQGFLRVYLPEASTDYQLGLYHIGGAMVWQGSLSAGMQEVQLPGELAKGIYLLKVSGEKGVVVKRLVKE